MTSITTYVIQYTWSNKPDDVREWLDYGWDVSVIQASAAAIEAQQKHPTMLFRLMRRQITEEVITGPEE